MKIKFSIFYFLFSIFYCFSQPKLVVGIVVDQMRYDYIERYKNKFGKDGFLRLVNEGFFCKNTCFNYVPTFTGPGHASIYTGVTPSVHGIVSNLWVDRETKKIVYCVSDTSVSATDGKSAVGNMSPKNLLSSTLGDELRKQNKNKSKVIAIALKDRSAVLPAGKNPTAAYWYDGTNGNWLTSSYYMKELPQWVTDFNKKELVKKYLSQTWNTFLPIEQYTESSPDDNFCEQPFRGKAAPVFPYNLSELMNQNGGLGLLRSTPFGNTLTKDFAIETIINENLGKGNAPDFLCVSFSSPDYIGHQFGPQSIEVEDTYIRLDKELAGLLKFLDDWVGKKNCLVFLTADHAAGEAVPCLLAKNISAGVAEEKIIEDSLKKYFSRTYNDLLLIKVSDFDVYLDRKKIADKKLSLTEVQKKTADYLLTLIGIADAIPAELLLKENFNDSIRSKVKAGFHPSRSGDVIFVLKPNWLMGFYKGTSHGSPYHYDTHVPLLWWGYTVKQGSSEKAVSITQIAPTVSKLMKIPKPNGCTIQPIKLSIK